MFLINERKYYCACKCTFVCDGIEEVKKRNIIEKERKKQKQKIVQKNWLSKSVFFFIYTLVIFYLYLKITVVSGKICVDVSNSPHK